MYSRVDCRNIMKAYGRRYFKNCVDLTWCWWLMFVILVIWEANIGRIAVEGQFRQIFHKTPSSK
jgi:hypothetical protein